MRRSRYALRCTLLVALVAASANAGRAAPPSSAPHGLAGPPSTTGTTSTVGVATIGVTSTTGTGGSTSTASSTATTASSPTTGPNHGAPTTSPTHAAPADPAPSSDPSPGHSASSNNGGPGSFLDAILSAVGFSDPAAAVEEASVGAQNQISACGEDDFTCIADALDEYAAALRKLAPTLPPSMQRLPDIVSRAAIQVRHAKTKGQAAGAIKVAIAEVHKTIALLKADEPVLVAYDAQSRELGAVVKTLEVASDKLEKATGL
jgi:hypothetical protein